MTDQEYLIIEQFSEKEHKRIFAKIYKDPVTGCWIWTGARDKKGYGLLWFRRRVERIHHVIFAWKTQAIPRGQVAKTKAQLDHLCRNPSCCNPDHLELVTHRINVLRGSSPVAQSARRTHCIRGHPLTTAPSGRRYCRTCDSIRKKERMQGPNREYWLQKARENAKRYYDKHLKKQ